MVAGMVNAASKIEGPTLAKKSWREDAAKIVEGLFACTSAGAWDILLDLRCRLLEGENWTETLDLFLYCRQRLEAEHYLPFYRLRRLLADSLRLEAGRDQNRVGSLREVLRSKHRSLDDFKRRVHREIFEHDLQTANSSIRLQVVECRGSAVS
jgi:hypothetical protein